MNDPLKVRPKTLRSLLADPPRSNYPKKDCKLTWTEGRGRRTINQRQVIKMTRKQLEYEINVTASTTATALVEQRMHEDITTATTRKSDETAETVRIIVERKLSLRVWNAEARRHSISNTKR